MPEPVANLMQQCRQLRADQQHGQQDDEYPGGLRTWAAAWICG
jgi:hypothetical protein